MTPAADKDAPGSEMAAAAAVADQKLLSDLREANEKLLLATLRAQELTELAEAAQASAELANERLRDSERELRDTAEFRERLLGIIGHDLRGPLGAISMAAQLLITEGHTDRDSVRTLVEFLLKSVRRMDRMIKQLFQFTHARFGNRMPLEMAPSDMRAICEHTLEEMALTSTVKTKAEYLGDTTGTWDAERLIEVLANLLGNAMDHATPDTGVRIRVQGLASEVVVEVINEGNPLPEELLPVLFLAFHRGRSKLHAKAGHLGLGLYIAHAIVRSHGGTLTAHSAAGSTTFVMRLPRTSMSSVSAPARI